MHWTKANPKKEGWYWVKWPTGGEHIMHWTNFDGDVRCHEHQPCKEGYLFSSTPIPKPTKKPKVSREDCEDIICHLNERTGKSFKSTSRATCNLIQARYNEGFGKEDFFKAIDNQSRKWGQDPNMIDYLRPQTLFGTKFEAYVQNGSKIIKPKPKKRNVSINDLVRAEGILRNLGSEKFNSYCKQLRFTKDDIDKIVCKVDGTRDVYSLVGGIGGV